MNIEANNLPCQLAEAGLYVTGCTVIFSRVKQYRYTLRQRQSETFVAFFCYYENNVNSFLTKAELSPLVTSLAQKWLDNLYQLHFVDSRPR